MTWILRFLCLLAYPALYAIQTVVICSDYELGDSFYAKVNARLIDYGIELKRINFSDYEQEDSLPEDPIIFFNCPWQGKKLLGYPTLQEKRSMILWEPPTIYPDLYQPHIFELFHKIYTWNDTLVDGVHCLKFYYPSLQRMIRDVLPFHEKKLCTQISANKHSPHPDQLYSHRESVIQFFESFEQEDFHFYGYGWESSGYKNYRGAPDDKIRTLRNYRFNFCYENIKDLEGYVTEKIFDSFTAGCIPVYRGANNITHYVPKECFIDVRDFSSLDDLYLFLKNMTEHDYEAYLSHIRKFLESEQAQLFTREYFDELFFQAVLGEAGVL